MKKYILLFLLVFLLTGCETADPQDTDPSCFTGFHIEDGVCVKDDDPVDPIDPTDPNFDNDTCTHLEDIGEWQAVWCDEFNYTGLPDSDKWNYDIGGNGWGNGEDQYYTLEDEDNAYVEDGYLTITAIKESYQSNNYTSARLITKNNGDWLYGKIQIKAKLPSGRGTWPAIWMLPTDWEYGGWPDSGEIDIMEHVGYDPNNVHTTLHTAAYNHMLNTQIGYSYSGTTFESDFHLYEIEWEPGVIRTYVDDILIATFEFDPEDNAGVENYEAWPFDKDFHLILNIAVGGAWGGANGVDPSIWPQEMVVDYVRVYQKDYAGMDETAPEVVTNIETLVAKNSTAYIAWDKAIDDVMIKEYDIYIDDVLYETTTLNGLLIKNLLPETSYQVKIIAVDFADNNSPEALYTLETAPTQLITTRVEAENYDTMQGIQTEIAYDSGGGLNVGWTNDGDYLTYNLKVVEAGTYTTDFRLASGASGGTFYFIVDGVILDTITFDGTGGWQNWITVTSDQYQLTEGVHEFKIHFISEGTNINYFETEKVE